MCCSHTQCLTLAHGNIYLLGWSRHKLWKEYLLSYITHLLIAIHVFFILLYFSQGLMLFYTGFSFIFMLAPPIHLVIEQGPKIRPDYSIPPATSQIWRHFDICWIKIWLLLNELWAKIVKKSLACWVSYQPKVAKSKPFLILGFNTLNKIHSASHHQSCFIPVTVKWEEPWSADRSGFL